jgi:hypothetical protein
MAAAAVVLLIWIIIPTSPTFWPRRDKMACSNFGTCTKKEKERAKKIALEGRMRVVSHAFDF